MSERITWIPVLALILVLAAGSVQADHEWDHRYTIEGKILSPDGNAVRWMNVGIDCSDGATEQSLCGHNANRSDSTGFFGSYELVLHVHSTDDGKLLVLNVDGQRSEHTMDLIGPDGEPLEEDRFVNHDLRLDVDPGFWHSLAASLLLASVLLGGLLGLIIKIRKPKQKASKIVTSYSSSGGFVDCPECSARLRPRNVEAHLLKAHGIEASSTGETES